MKMSNGRVIDGISIRDIVYDQVDVVVEPQSLGIFIVGWESRSLHILSRAKISGKIAVLIRFDDDGISEGVQSKFEEFARLKFEHVQVRKLCSAKKASQLKGELESLVSELKLADLSQVSIDYSSMPRVVLQTLFRLFITEGVSPRVNWMYSSGSYDDTSVVERGFQQGVEGSLFSVHGGYGKPISEKRIGVVSLGADQDLVSTFLRQENYEDIFFIYSPSRTSTQLKEKIEFQRFWLRSHHGISDDQMFLCDEHDVVSSLGVLSDILIRYSDHPNASFDIFCAGPKTHSIAASALLTKFKNVRLLGRIPKEYSRMDIQATGLCTVTQVTDYTNVLVGRMLMSL